MSDLDSRPAVAFHPAAAGRAMSFGPFRFDRVDRTLSRDGVPVHLPPRVLAVLECLIDRPGRVVAKDTLLDAGWPDAHVGESSLTEAIGQLRQAFGDSPQTPAYIQTVHRRGYRFVAPVTLDVAHGASGLLRTVGPQPSAVTVARAEVDSPSVVREAAADRTRGWAGGARGRRAGLLIVGATALVITLIVVAAIAWRPVSTAVSRTTIALAPEQAPAPALTAYPVAAIAPDGTRLVYVAGTTGRYQLFERALDHFDSTPIPGTEGAHGAFFSPDGASIAYFKDGFLHTMPLATRQPLRLAQTGASFGGTWLDDSILVATGGPTGLMRIGLRDGSTSTVPVEGDRGAAMRFPQALPGGLSIVATEWGVTQRDSHVVIVDLASGAVTRIAPGVSPRYMSPGWLTWVRHDVLMARPFPGDGQPVAMVSGVMTSTVGGAQYATSASGTLVYVPSEPERRQRDVVRHVDGVTTPLGFESREYQNIAVSPDGSLVATTIYGEGASDLWLGDVARGTLTRLTSDGASIDPTWTPDGRFILFGWLDRGRIHIRRVAPNAAGPPETIAHTTDVTPLSVAPDGSILGQRLHPTRAMDLVLVDPGTREARDWLATPASEVRGRISPNGRWVIFDSDRSGRREIYLRPFRDPSSAEWQVSPSGGRDAHWHPDGRRIVYTRGAGELYEVPIAQDGRLGVATRVGGARDLTQLRAGMNGGLLAIRRTNEEQPVAAFRLVSGWQHEVRARLGR